MFQLVDMNHLLESYMYSLYTEDALVHQRRQSFEQTRAKNVGINTSVFLGKKNIQKKTTISSSSQGNCTSMYVTNTRRLTSSESQNVVKL